MKKYINSRIEYTTGREVNYISDNNNPIYKTSYDIKYNSLFNIIVIELPNSKCHIIRVSDMKVLFFNASISSFVNNGIYIITDIEEEYYIQTALEIENIKISFPLTTIVDDSQVKYLNSNFVLSIDSSDISKLYSTEKLLHSYISEYTKENNIIRFKLVYNDMFFLNLDNNNVSKEYEYSSNKFHFNKCVVEKNNKYIFLDDEFNESNKSFDNVFQHKFLDKDTAIVYDRKECSYSIIDSNYEYKKYYKNNINKITTTPYSYICYSKDNFILYSITINNKIYNETTKEVKKEVNIIDNLKIVDYILA